MPHLLIVNRLGHSLKVRQREQIDSWKVVRRRPGKPTRRFA
ncbi:hypothetical protein [Pseudomonas asplenii]